MILKPLWTVISAIAGTALVAGGTVATVRYLQTQASETAVVSQTASQTAETTSAAATSDGNETGSQTSATSVATLSASVVGEYWCRSYNVNGAGGSCSTQRRLYLKADGSYDFGSTGRWSIIGSTVTFDGDLASRGPANLTAARELRWEFSRDDKPYTITYYWRQAISEATTTSDSSTPAATAASTSAAATATKTPQSQVTTVGASPAATATSSATPSSSASATPTASATTTAPNISGSYACLSFGNGPCETSQNIEVFTDGSWYFGSNVGTYQVSGSTVNFYSPYAGGSGWASAGPADWGPATLSGNSLTFYNEGVPVRFER